MLRYACLELHRALRAGGPGNQGSSLSLLSGVSMELLVLGDGRGWLASIGDNATVGGVSRGRSGIATTLASSNALHTLKHCT